MMLEKEAILLLKGIVDPIERRSIHTFYVIVTTKS